MMRVEQIRKSIPKTMDRIQSRVEKMGSDVVDRFEVARKAVRRGSEETTKWVKKNPAALPLIGLGGAVLGTFLMMRARRRSRGPKLVQGAMKFAQRFPQLRKGFGSVLGRFFAWALTPRKPTVIRAVSIRW